MIYCKKQIESGFDFLDFHDGGSKYSDLIKRLTGTYSDRLVSVPRNQMFVTFETTSIVERRGFQASIHENST